MKFEPPLIEAVLLRRYQRFLADVRLKDGQEMTVHCANTGSMQHCVVPGSPCWISLSDNPKRKLPGTLEITTTTLGFKAGVNTARPNQLVREGIESGLIGELQGYASLRQEVKYGSENSRIDLLLEKAGERCFVEVKNVTLERGDGLVCFPDAVTSRGAKHLRELMAMVAEGYRAVLVFCVQHSGATSAAVAADIDPLYAQTLADALAGGVEVLAYGCSLSAGEIALGRRIAFRPGVCDIEPTQATTRLHA
jgi:sugar fermentation stimulation protein A